MATRRKQYLATRVEPEVKAGVRELARRESRTMSQTVALLVTEALRAREIEKKFFQPLPSKKELEEALAARQKEQVSAT